MFNERIVLITGGTGSLGKALAKHILKEYKVKKLIIFSRDWLKQLELKDDLGERENVRYFIGDVRSLDRLKLALDGVDYVIHAAAIKDLDTCSYNPNEAVLTNVIGTQNVAMACIHNRVKMAVFISTDKAVNPINTYGKTKALAEDLWLHSAAYASNRTWFTVARYGNIFGSAGSVVPRFKKMIANGVELLPLTHFDCTRYFFTLDQAIRLIEQCISSKDGAVLIPKMPSYYVRDLIRAFGKPFTEIGLRENEKIDETCDGITDSHENTDFLTTEDLRKEISKT